MHALAMTLTLLVLAQPASSPPKTPIRPVVDVLHGVSITDPYRWLEDWSDPEVQAWSDAQNQHARAYLDALPDRASIRTRVRSLIEAASIHYHDLDWTGRDLLALKSEPSRQQAFLVAMPGPDQPEGERVLVDPNEIDSTGATHIDWFRPSPDGSLVAVSISVGGTESGDVHVYDTATGAESTDDVVARVNGGTAGGDLAWDADSGGFFYTRYPRAGEREGEDLNFYQQVYHHTLGEATGSDRYEIGTDLPRIAEITLESEAAEGRVLATVQNGDSGRFAFYVRDAGGSWRQISGFDSPIVQATFGPGGSIYAVSRGDKPRGSIVRIDPASQSPLGDATPIVDEGEDTIVTDFYGHATLIATHDRLYATYQLGGPSEIRAFEFDGTPATGPQIPEVSSVGQIVPTPSGAVMFEVESYVSPPAWRVFDPETGSTEATPLAMDSPADFSDVEVVREWADSKDGTRVPINIIRPTGISLDGSNPVLLTAYGGYGISLEPRFSASRRAWLDQGGVYAVGNIRGGGEFGDAWHQAGRLLKKQNVFDDFAACMEHMIDAGYTSPRRLAITGGSNGGLLMGAMITQHPNLFRAVVSFVGIYDMLRFELSPNGAFNIPEFGTVKDEEQFRAMYAYSPYQHVRQRTPYPAVLFMTGANDPRVDPMHSRKMTAILQAATASDRPILLRTSNTGHGGGTPLGERIEQITDMDAFLLNQLGVAWRNPGGTGVPPIK